MRRTPAAILLALALAGCATPEPPAAIPPPPAGAILPPPFLVSTDEIPGEFSWRQEIEAHHPGGVSRFEAVVQKRCGELVVVGFAPFGARAFSLRQRGLEVTAEVDLGPPPFPPEAVLYDVHRTFFARFGPPLADGERTLQRGGESIDETWRDGRLRTRRYRRLDGRPAGSVEIDYGEGLGPDGPPDLVELRSGWFGYVLRIRTLERKEAPCGDRARR